MPIREESPRSGFERSAKAVFRAVTSLFFVLMPYYRASNNLHFWNTVTDIVMETFSVKIDEKSVVKPESWLTKAE
ncbi:hypothetical protein GCM10028773_16570 [Spirosoma koreense]